MKINMTGDSWDTLRGIVRDAGGAGAGAGADAAPKKVNGAAHDDAGDDDDDEDDDSPHAPTEDWKKWRKYADDQAKRRGHERTRRKTAEAKAAEAAATVAALQAKYDTDLAAARTAAQNDRDAAIAEARKAGDGRLVRIELKRALKESGCKDVDAALQITDASGIKVTDAGDVEGVEAVITELKKSKAYLFGEASTTTTTTGSPKTDIKGVVDVRTMSNADYAAYKKSMGLK